MAEIFGGIEAGGTKFICAIGADPENIHSRIRIETTTPAETIGKAIDYFRQQQEQYSLTSIGIGSFGPLDLDKNSNTYGCITSTPKPGWRNTDLVKPIRQALKIPIAFDTDVNAAALGEYRWGAARTLTDFIYLTIGTGIGGGGMQNGKLIHGLSHPEMGHILLPHDSTIDSFTGCCPFHNDCFEGLASGPAIEKRWGVASRDLPDDHPAWELEAHYIALACVNYTCTLLPQRIILGGGVMNRKILLPLIHAKTRRILNDYIQLPLIVTEIENYIVLPGLGNAAGIAGAIALARSLTEDNLD
jgi:fructokinase